MTNQNEDEQTEAFPRSTLEILEQLRGVHHAAYEKAVDALDKLGDDEEIAKRYQKAEEKVAGARELVRNIDRAIEEMKTFESQSVEGIVRPSGESVTFGRVCDNCANKEDCSLRMPGQSMGCGGNAWMAALDPITGEPAAA